jgi:hypothetical protein
VLYYLKILLSTYAGCELPEKFEVVKRIWTKAGDGITLWRRVLHTLESIDYWFLEVDGYYFNDSIKGVSAELDTPCMEVLTKKEIAGYFEKVEGKCRRFFASLDDAALLAASAKHERLTILDVILTHIRHVQLNIGYCSQVLNASGVRGVAWKGFGE